MDYEIGRGIAADNIIIGGFSQGGAIALAVALQYEQQLAGAIVLSSYLPIAEQTLTNLSPANKNMPIFIAHGTEDAVVPYAWGRQTRDYLIHHPSHPYSVEWHDYPIEHSTCPQEVNDIANWLITQCGKKEG